MTGSSAAPPLQTAKDSKGAAPGSSDGGKGSGDKGGGGGEGAISPARLDVFAYPSMLSPTTNEPEPPRFASILRRVGSNIGLAGWDYVAGEGEGPRGQRLWRRVRARVDNLARLQGLPRDRFLINFANALASESSERSDESDEAAAFASGGRVAHSPVDVEAQRARLRNERESLLSAGYPAEDPLVRDLDRLIAAAE